MILDFSTVLPFFAFGVVVGGLYFWLLWRAVKTMSIVTDLWRVGANGIWFRLVLLVLSFAVFVIFKADAIGIIIWLIGLLAVRVIVIRRLRIPIELFAKAGG